MNKSKNFCNELGCLKFVTQNLNRWDYQYSHQTNCQTVLNINTLPKVG